MEKSIQLVGDYKFDEFGTVFINPKITPQFNLKLGDVDVINKTVTIPCLLEVEGIRPKLIHAKDVEVESFNFEFSEAAHVATLLEQIETNLMKHKLDPLAELERNTKH